MSTIGLITLILQTLSGIPYVGPVIVFVLNLVMPASVVMTAFVVVWQGVVGLLNAVGAIPGLSFLVGIATKLKAEEDAVEGIINNDILPIIKALSAIPIPTKIVIPVK